MKERKIFTMARITSNKTRKGTVLLGLQCAKGLGWGSAVISVMEAEDATPGFRAWLKNLLDMMVELINMFISNADGNLAHDSDHYHEILCLP